jgi:hypothetical protein
LVGRALAAATYHKQTNKQASKQTEPARQGPLGNGALPKAMAAGVASGYSKYSEYSRWGWHYRRLVENVAEILAVLQRWLLRQESFQIVSSSRACGFRAAVRP